MAETRNFYHAVILGMTGIVAPVSGRMLFLPHDSDCLHEVSSEQVLVTGEVSSSMQHFLQAELARRMGEGAR